MKIKVTGETLKFGKTKRPQGVSGVKYCTLTEDHFFHNDRTAELFATLNGETKPFGVVGLLTNFDTLLYEILLQHDRQNHKKQE